MPSFSKLMAATTVLFSTDAPSTAYGHKLQLKLQLPESCTANLDRLFNKANTSDFTKYSGSGKKYEDPSFPANNYSLYWTSHMEDSEMKNTYDSKVTGWARPSELVPSGKPSLWGSKGVKPAGVN